MGQPRTTLIAGAIAIMAMASGATAQDVDARADEILKAMSDYLAGLETFSVTVDASTEMLLRDGAKVQMTGTGEVILDR